MVDLAVTNFDSNQNPNVSILLGNGDGTFQNPANYELPPDQFQTPTAITASDLDGDDAPDVAVANTGNRSEVVVFLNKGDGTLEAPVSYDPVLKQAYPLAFTTSDFNGDGKADLVVGYLLAFNGVGNIAVFLGNGGGTLQDPVAFNSGTQELTSLTAADLNGDSVADLATTSQGTDDQGPRTPLFSLATATAPSRHPRLMRPAAVRRSSRLRISTETRSRILPPRTQAPTTSRSCSTSRRRRSRR